MSSVKCRECGLVNFATDTSCKRCGSLLQTSNIQNAPPGSVVTEDGYVLPPPPMIGAGLPGSGVWRDKSTLVMDKNAVLPDRCVKCNEPALGVRLKRKLNWHHPALYLVILAGLLIYFIIAMIIRKSAQFEVGICERHLKKRRVAIAVAWLLVIGGLVLFFAAVSWNESGLILLGFVLFLGGVVYGITGTKVVAPAKIDDRYVWLRGVNKNYLNAFPQWPGY